MVKLATWDANATVTVTKNIGKLPEHGGLRLPWQAMFDMSSSP